MKNNEKYMVNKEEITINPKNVPIIYTIPLDPYISFYPPAGLGAPFPHLLTQGLRPHIYKP